jgi:hypothetical protein
MAVDDPLNRRQPDSAAREFLLGMKPLEGTKQPVRVSHIEARAIVPHEVGRLP